jgi:hypothetical protein
VSQVSPRAPSAPAVERDLAAPLRQGAWGAWAALAAASGTLVCCALPALLVMLGAGASLAGLVSVFPQIVWLSEHKALVFGVALAAMAVAGALQWRNRRAPCPTDPTLREACLRTRLWSARVFGVALLLLALGAWFAFVQPLIGA